MEDIFFNIGIFLLGVLLGKMGFRKKRKMADKLVETKGNGVLVLLPSIDDATETALTIASNIEPKLTENQEAFFIAGFQECIKYLRDDDGYMGI